MANLLERVKRLEAAYQQKGIINIEVDGYSFCLTANNASYFPTQTAKAFHACNDTVRLVMGPYGSGKSTLCCADIVLRAVGMPVCTDGIRRSRWVAIRNTYPELKTTTLQTWMDWYGNLGATRLKMDSPISFTAEFRDEKGLIKLEMFFLSIDRPEDIKKLLSLEVTGILINEAKELPEALLVHAKGRINRYPSKKMVNGQPYWSGIIMDTNPPHNKHWIYNLFEIVKPTGHTIFKQPPAVIKTDKGYITNPEADNLINHNNPRYYDEMINGQTEEFIRVFAMGQYGAVIDGRRVYPEYNDDLHSKDTLQPIKDLPISLGFDFGLTPACVITQTTQKGQLLILKELVSQSMGITQFVDAVVKPYLKQHFPNHKVEFCVGDPAGNQRVATDEATCLEVLKDAQFPAEGASTNELIPRLESVRWYLTRLVDGQPALILSRSGCETLRLGFLGDYHYKRMQVTGEERYQEKPNKNSASHPHDALQYIALKYRAEFDVPQIDLKKFYNPMGRLGNYHG